MYNNNSSRFGKFIRLNFSKAGNIVGGRISDCILVADIAVSVRSGGRGDNQLDRQSDKWEGQKWNGGKGSLH